MYRFGDSTPFPLRENFIETIAAVVDAAVALYRADALADEAHRRAREVRRAAADELRRLDAVSALVQTTIGPLAPTGAASRESDRATGRIVELSRDVIKQARDAVVSRRDEAIRTAMTSRHHELSRAALASLFAAHGLPGGQWAVEWNARGGDARLLVSQQATPALSVEMLGALPEGDRFARPLRVSELCPTLAQVQIGEAGDRKRSGDKLGQLAVLELDLSPHGVRLAIGRPDRKAPGLVVVRRDDRPLASWLTAEGELGGRIALDPAAEAALGELCDAAEACRAELVGRRDELHAAALHGQPVDELEQPGSLAEELLAAIAPLTREMRLRSRVPGELVLKRDLGGDRREELFVPRRALTARFAELPDQQRRAFEAIGLGEEGTIEFRARLARGTGTPAQVADDLRPRARSPRPARSYGELSPER
jgi:hypothetical protein